MSTPTTTVPPRIPLRYRVPWKQLVVYTLAILFALYLVLPFYWIVITSFRHEGDVTSVPPQWLPVRLTLQNYWSFVHPTRAQVAQSDGAVADLLHSLLNSAIVAVATTVLSLLLSILAAYSFARLRFRGSGVVLGLYLATRMVPGIALIIPFYLLMRNLGLLDTYWALILSYSTFALPFTVWILKDYFRSIPIELEDAARVDRCGWFRMMWRVFLPIASPGLVAASVFSFMTAWNEFMFALFMTSTINSETVPVIAATFANDFNVQYAGMAAAGVVAVVPPLVVALAFQRLIVQGLAAGSVKG
jgi:multiple sugar transport system permease protein